MQGLNIESRYSYGSARHILKRPLGTGLNWHDKYKLQHNRPLPLPELLDSMYLELDGQPAANLAG